MASGVARLLKDLAVMTSDLLDKHPELILGVTNTLRDAMESMTKSRHGIVLIIDGDRRLLGVLTDLDIRKALLQGQAMDWPVTKAMNPHPITVSAELPQEAIVNIFRETSKTHIPIIDASGRLQALAVLLDYVTIPKRYPNRVVIMAGGSGQRLRPLTENTPKPMLKVGNKPILELLLEQFIASGFGHFIFTVNYLAEQICAHFGDGSRWGVEIEYVRESEPLGTVGALGLIRQDLKQPLIVVNGDILTKVNFNALLEFHKAEKGLATLCVKHHEIQVPYGVIELDNHRLERFIEKPTHRFLVNAGIYVVEPEALAWLPKNKPCDMPEFLKEIRSHRPGGVMCFPIQEYWIDIGGLSEFNRAVGEYGEVFDIP